MVKRVQYSGHCLLLLFFIDWVSNYQITLSIIISSQYYAICRHLRIHSAKNIWWCLALVGVYKKQKYSSKKYLPISKWSTTVLIPLCEFHLFKTTYRYLYSIVELMSMFDEREVLLRREKENVLFNIMNTLIARYLLIVQQFKLAFIIIKKSLKIPKGNQKT